MREPDDQPTMSLPSVGAEETFDAQPPPALGGWIADGQAATYEPQPDEARDDREPGYDLVTYADLADEVAQGGRGELLLAAAPSTVSPDELDVALSTPPPSARSLRATKLLSGALIVALGFVGGVYVGQQTGQPQQTAGPVGFTRGAGLSGQGFSGAGSGSAPGGTAGTGSGAGSGAGSTGGGGGATTASTTTEGTVKLVDGSVIYLTDADGTLTRVVVGKDTDVVQTKEIDLEDIDTGDKVTVTGTASADGVAATTVAVAK